MRKSGRCGRSPARNVVRNPLLRSCEVSVAVETRRRISMCSVGKVSTADTYQTCPEASGDISPGAVDAEARYVTRGCSEPQAGLGVFFSMVALMRRLAHDLKPEDLAYKRIRMFQ